MSTSTHYVVTTSAVQEDKAPSTTMSDSRQQANGTAEVTASNQQSKPKFRSKYKHIEALHKRPRTSILSHDSQEVPSFLGFRNLMVLTISELM